MLAVFSTLASLATLWLLAAVALRMIEESGGKVLAALKGQASFASAPLQAPVPVRVRYRSATQAHPVRARPKLRAAA